jgi:hypothetical protein
MAFKEKLKSLKAKERLVSAMTAIHHAIEILENV